MILLKNLLYINTTVVQWLGLHVSSCLGDFSSGTSGFLPQSKHKHVRFIDDSKLVVGVNVTVNVEKLSVSLCVSPVINLQPVWVVPCLFSHYSWDRQPRPP